jgi:outer membrane protein OmpA-like peptidoglycan-associated protein
MKPGKVFLIRLSACFLLLQMLQSHLVAQDLIGYNYNNYIGVNGIVSNPASIAASRYKVHVNLVTANAYAGSNAYDFNSKKFFKFQFKNWAEGTDYRKDTSNQIKNAWANTDILGPSFLINLKTKGALGFTTRFRTIVNADNFSSGAFSLFGSYDPATFGINYNEKQVNVNASSFADVGITYAKILKHRGKTLLKGGFTMKYIKGISSASMRVDSININIQDLNTIQKLNGGGSLLYADNIDRLTQTGASTDFISELKKGSGTFGLDLGLVYEHRSGKFDPKYGTLKSLYRTIPYDFRWSISVTDLAFAPVKYTSGTQSAYYTLSADNVDKDTFSLRGQSSDVYIQRLQNSYLLSKQEANEAFEMALPTTIRTNFDYHVSTYFFVNADAMISIRGPKSEKIGNHYISTFSLTPRFEKQWYTVYSPVSYDIRKQLNWGAGFRVGPLFAGSGSVLSNLIKTDFRNADAHIGLSVPIYQGTRTRKGKRDIEEKPEEEPRPVAAKPAPAKPVAKAKVLDRDKDGINDDVDACPDVPGLKEYNGCPDTDKDGVGDNKDKCPTIAGTFKYDGCPVPDSDNDGVTDEADKCPKIPGPVTNNGCPEIKKEIKQTVATAAKNLFFVTGKATIQTRSFPALNKIASILRKDSTLTLDIEGHTDNVGNDEKNMRLSSARAAAAKQYLVEIGIDPARITTTGYGETQPVASNATKEGRAKNRRIVLTLRNY